MRHAARQEELTMVVSRQLNRDMLSVSRAIVTDVDGHIKHTSFDYADQFGLRIGRTLEMQAANDTVARTRLIILYETDVVDTIRKITRIITLKKVSSGITKHPRLNDEKALYCCLYDVHVNFLYPLLRRSRRHNHNRNHSRSRNHSHNHSRSRNHSHNHSRRNVS